MDDEQIITDVHDAIAAALAKHERSMLGKWVVIAETTDDEGKRGVWSLASADNLLYETLGLLHYALTREIGDEDDDD